MKTAAMILGLIVIIAALSALPAIVLKLTLLAFGYDVSFWLCYVLCLFFGGVAGSRRRS